MDKRAYLIFLSLILLISFCTTDPEVKIEGPLNRIGLKGVNINAINAYSNEIFLLTDEGIYLKKDGNITRFGLKGKDVIGLVYLESGSYLAGTYTFELADGVETIYKNEDGEWNEFMANYGGEEGLYTRVSNLTLDSKNNSLYASGAGNVSLSTDSGSTWEVILGSWDSISRTNFLEFQTQTSDTIWMGGSNSIGRPTLYRSTDNGQNWDFIRTLEFAENENHDIHFDKTNSDHVVVGLAGGVRSSLDFGETWETILTGQYIFKVFSSSSLTPGKIYLSGQAYDKSFFLFTSYNNGYTWEEIQFDEVPENIEVNDMIVQIEEGREVLYLGTNRGLFKYLTED